MHIIDNIPVWGSPVDEGALKQIKTCYYIFGQAAMMADHHKGYGVPIGGVIAHENLVSPSGVGFDIGCGNKAVLTDADAADVRANIAKIMDDVWSTISFGLARKNGPAREFGEVADWRGLECFALPRIFHHRPSAPLPLFGYPQWPTPRFRRRLRTPDAQAGHAQLESAQPYDSMSVHVFSRIAHVGLEEAAARAERRTPGAQAVHGLPVVVRPSAQGRRISEHPTCNLLWASGVRSKPLQILATTHVQCHRAGLTATGPNHETQQNRGLLQIPAQSRKNKEHVDHELFDDNDDDAWQITQGASSAAWKLTSLRDLARAQLGTVGSGNHYVDIFEDEQSRIWIGAHFGSRGFGHKIATRFLNRAGAKDDMDSAPVALDARTQEGQDYIAAMKLAGRYAYAGRDWVCGRVAKILGARVLDSVHNHHNFAWRETHQDRELWVVRKGATPAFPGQKGFVGGSMAEISVIIEGVEHQDTAHTLYSTVHGAGRVMGRMDAKGKIDRKTGEVKRAGKVTPEMMREWVAREQVELRGAGVDESPHCYKRLPEVLAEHEGTIRILHTLHPLGVAMAGADVFDPYKIGIGAAVTRRPLPHHRTYGSVYGGSGS